MSLVQQFGAKGDGQNDDTAAISHAIQRGDGHLVFSRGEYLITKPLYIPLEQFGRIAIDGSGGTAKLIMVGPGPALHLVGTHKKNALPASFAEGVWQKERMPTVQNLEIVGRHPEADGIRIEGVMQPTLTGLLIRKCRHGIHLLNRDRNVIVADCHIYDNSGVGLFLDRLNLHQINVHGNHISYCKQGGIKVVASEIRNLQICSNDIEYNFDRDAATSADILLDSREGTVREGTIVGNTIQALRSPRGANVRMIGVGKGVRSAVGMFTITGNLIGDQMTSIHLQSCRGVVISANCSYSGFQNSLWLDDCEHIVLSGNSIDHNSDYKGKSTDRILLERSRNVTMTGMILQHTREQDEPHDASLEITECQEVSVTGCHILGARQRGILVRDSSLVRVADSTIRSGEGNGFEAAIRVDAKSSNVLVVNNFLA